MFSRTVEAIDRNLKGISGNWERVFTHNESIPEAQNTIVERARIYNPNWLWFVEEDMVPPDGTLRKLLKHGKDYSVVSAKYKLRGNTWAHSSCNGDLVYTGLGCLLVDISVFNIIDYPYFRTDRQFSQDLKTSSKSQSPYGGQDIYFFAQLMEKSIQPKLIDVECEHLYVKKFGNIVNNVGFHEITSV